MGYYVLIKKVEAIPMKKYVYENYHQNNDYFSRDDTEGYFVDNDQWIEKSEFEKYSFQFENGEIVTRLDNARFCNKYKIQNRNDILNVWPFLGFLLSVGKFGFDYTNPMEIEPNYEGVDKT